MLTVPVCVSHVNVQHRFAVHQNCRASGELSTASGKEVIDIYRKWGHLMSYYRYGQNDTYEVVYVQKHLELRVGYPFH